MAITGRTLQLEQQLRDSIAGITDQHTRELVKAWATAWDEVAPDLADTLEALLAPGTPVTRTQLLRSARLQKSLAVIASNLDELVRGAGITVVGELDSVIAVAGQAQAAIIASQLPAGARELVDLESWSRVDPRQISAIVTRSTQQITSTLKPLSMQAYAAVRRELIRGVASGSNPRETARRIVRRTEGEFNGGLGRALTIARTETLDAHRSAAALGQAKHTDVLTGWTWLASIGARTCPACWGMNGTFHELDEPGPSGHQNCRCARIPTTKPWSELGINTPEPRSLLPDADAEFARLTPAQQQGILGRLGFDAWKQGSFPRSQWAVRQSNPGWRDSYVPRSAPKVTGLAAKKTPARKPAPKKAPAARKSKDLAPGWQTLDTAQIKATISDGTALGDRVAAKIRKAYQSGPHLVTIESTLTNLAAKELLTDVTQVLADAQKILGTQRVRVHVPTGDSEFRNTGSGIVAGYVTIGDDVIFLNPGVADGSIPRMLAATRLSNQMMDAVDAAGFRRYTLTHELGHVMDGHHDHVRLPGTISPTGRFNPGNISPAERAFHTSQLANLSMYGRTSPQEGYAEAFAQWTIGGPGTSPAADAYAARYRWT